MKTTHISALLFATLCSHVPQASAYIGPGLGTGAIAATLGILAGILMLIVGVIWYPLKRLLKKRKARAAGQ